MSSWLQRTMFAAALRRCTELRLGAVHQHRWAFDREVCEVCGETRQALVWARGAIR